MRVNGLVLHFYTCKELHLLDEQGSSESEDRQEAAPGEQLKKPVCPALPAAEVVDGAPDDQVLTVLVDDMDGFFHDLSPCPDMGGTAR